MCTSVPHTPARRTRISTSSSRIFGSGTSFKTKPGCAAAFTSAFTREISVDRGNRNLKAKEPASLPALSISILLLDFFLHRGRVLLEPEVRSDPRRARYGLAGRDHDA